MSGSVSPVQVLLTGRVKNPAATSRCRRVVVEATEDRVGARIHMHASVLTIQMFR
jgi:hypothetical protein